jgi:cysteine-rich repeat protein
MSASMSASADDDGVSSDGADDVVDEDSGSESDDGVSTDDSGSESSGPACGDGNVDDGEDCDDGNDVDGDGCNVDCVVSGTVQWEVLYDGPEGLDDCAHDVAINDDGVIALAGQTADTEAYDVLAIALAGDGTVMWDAIHDSDGEPESGGGSTDRAYGVAIEADGEVIVAGYEYLDIETVWVRKLDADGETVWTRTGADTHAGRAYGVGVNAAGDVYVVGTHGLYAFVSHYNSNGIEFWTEERKGTEGCNGCDSFYRVYASEDGDPFVVGQLDNTTSDAFVGRFVGPNGDDDWIELVDGGIDVDDYGYAIAPQGDSVVALLNWYDQVEQGSELRSYSQDGDLEWMLADPLSGAAAFDIAPTPDGGFVLVGDEWDAENGTTTHVSRFATDGAVAWEQELVSGPTGYQEVRGVAVAQDGRIAVGGCKTDPVEAPSTDAWAVLLAP